MAATQHADWHAPQNSNWENYLKFVCFPFVIFSCVSTHKVTHQKLLRARAGSDAADYFNISAYLNPNEAINLMVSLAQYSGDVSILETFQYMTYGGRAFHGGFYRFLCACVQN